MVFEAAVTVTNEEGAEAKSQKPESSSDEQRSSSERYGLYPNMSSTQGVKAN